MAQSLTPWVTIGLALAGVGTLLYLQQENSETAPGPTGARSRRRLIIKGNRVRFELTDGRVFALPPSYGMIHDASGESLSKCDVYFGPVEKTRTPVEMTRDARAYFGSTYPAKKAVVDVPKSAWFPVGDVVQIFYFRPGAHQGKYFHPFKRLARPLRLTKSASGSVYKIALPHGCVVNDRGFVYP